MQGSGWTSLREEKVLLLLGEKVEGVDEKVQELVGVCVMWCVGQWVKEKHYY